MRGLIRSPSTRGIAEEAPGAYKDVGAVVGAAEHEGLARRVARLRPLICIKRVTGRPVLIGVPKEIKTDEYRG